VVTPTRRPATTANYTHVVNTRIVPHLGRLRLDRLSVREIRAWTQTLQQAGDSPRMVQLSRAVLRSALSNAVTEQLVERNEAMLLRVPKPPRHRVTPWSAEEGKAFLKATRNHRLHTAFTLMLMLGLRRGEALGIAWDDLDLDKGLVHLRHQIQRGENGLVLQELKTEESAATLPLPTPVVDVLLEREQLQAYERTRPGWENWRGANLITTTLDGAPIEPRNLNRAFHTEAAKAALPRIRVHDTRHTCASLLRSYGVDLAVIQSILRHTQLSTTADIYLHVPTEDQRAALGLIANALDHTDHTPADNEDDSDTGDGDAMTAA
jgi:integrase